MCVCVCCVLSWLFPDGDLEWSQFRRVKFIKWWLEQIGEPDFHTHNPLCFPVQQLHLFLISVYICCVSIRHIIKFSVQNTKVLTLGLWSGCSLSLCMCHDKQIHPTVTPFHILVNGWSRMRLNVKGAMIVGWKTGSLWFIFIMCICHVPYFHSVGITVLWPTLNCDQSLWWQAQREWFAYDLNSTVKSDACCADVLKVSSRYL